MLSPFGTRGREGHCMNFGILLSIGVAFVGVHTVLGARGARSNATTKFPFVAWVAEFVFLFAVAAVPTTMSARFIVALFLGGYAGSAMVAHAFTRRVGFSPDANIIGLCLHSPAASLRFVSSELSAADLAKVFLAMGVAMLITLVSRPPMQRWISLSVMVTSLAVLAHQTIMSRSLPPVPALVRAFASALRRCATVTTEAGLGLPSRLVVPPQLTPAPQCDVILIVCESLARRVLDSDDGRAATPAYHRFVDENGELIIAASHALSSSACSEIAYASLFTGCSPEQPRALFHEVPLVWAHARARGYRTSLFSSTSLTWANLSAFLVDGTLDHAIYREVLEAPMVNELAMDDRVLTQIAIDHLLKQSQPSFTVINLNMLHHPFLVDEADRSVDRATPHARYRSALRVFDQCFDDLIGALRRSGRLERTVIVFVADHGEDPDAPAMRLYDLMPVYLDVPLWLYLPHGSVTNAARQQARENVRRPVATIDLYPTLLSLCDAAPPTPTATSFPALIRLAPTSAHNLFEPVPEDRVIVSLNTGGLRSWATEPFAVAHGGELLVYRDVLRRIELHSLDGASGDHWHAVSEHEREGWRQRLLNVPVIDDIATSRGLVPGVSASPRAIAAEYDALASLDAHADLHRLNNWKLFERADFEELCRRTIDYVGIDEDDTVLDAGCGAGAFSAVLLEYSRRVRVIGVDRSRPLIEVARRTLPQGSFHVASILDLSFLDDASVDHTISQAVLLYLSNLADVDRAAREFVRVTRPGGRIYIGQLNDPDRISCGGIVSGNSVVPRSFWTKFADSHKLRVDVVDQASIFSKAVGYDGWSRMRYAVLIRKR